MNNFHLIFVNVAYSLILSVKNRGGGGGKELGLINRQNKLRVIQFICRWSINHFLTLIKTEKNIFSTMGKRHQFMMYLHYVKDLYLYHLPSQIINIEEIALKFLDFLENRAIIAQLPIENDELLARASG